MRTALEIAIVIGVVCALLLGRAHGGARWQGRPARPTLRTGAFAILGVVAILALHYA